MHAGGSYMLVCLLGKDVTVGILGRRTTSLLYLMNASDYLESKSNPFLRKATQNNFKRSKPSAFN